jgi:lysosomal Pro-X carboxypeptidase
VTHLIWSNGGLDPWHGGGFLHPFANTDDLHWFFMPLGAHHLDLRGPHPEDPPNVTATRAAEEDILRGWIESCPQLG